MDFHNNQGRRIGKLELHDGERWLVKHVKSDVHMLRKPYGAWATDAEHIPLLRDAGAAGIRLIVDGSKVISARLEKIEEKGFKINRGQGSQIALMGYEWEEANDDDAD